LWGISATLVEQGRSRDNLEHCSRTAGSDGGSIEASFHGDCERLRQHAFWECAIAQTVRTQVQRGLGGALLQQWHLWLVDRPPVCKIVWRIVVLAAIWAMGKKRLWPLVHTPHRQGSAVQQAISEASTPFWSALHDFAHMIGQYQGKGWDEVGPDHPCLFASRFLCVRA
jgi:hypothetical protein